MEYVGRIIATIFGCLCLFVMPIMNNWIKMDDLIQTNAQDAVEEFVNKCDCTGKITSESYETLVSALDASGITYDIEIEHEKEIIEPATYDDGSINRNSAPISYLVTTDTSDILSTIYPEISAGTNEHAEDGIYKMSSGDYLTVTVVSNEATYGGRFMAVIGMNNGLNSKIVAKDSGAVSKVQNVVG